MAAAWGTAEWSTERRLGGAEDKIGAAAECDWHPCDQGGWGKVEEDGSWYTGRLVVHKEYKDKKVESGIFPEFCFSTTQVIHTEKSASSGSNYHDPVLGTKGYIWGILGYAA